MEPPRPSTLPVGGSRLSRISALLLVAGLALSFVVVPYAAASFAEAQVDTQYHEGGHDRYDVIENFYDNNGEWVPLRRGWWNGANGGFGYEKVKGKHGWNSVDEYRTENALDSPHDKEYEAWTDDNKTVVYKFCFWDQRTGTWWTRRVVVQYEKDRLGIVTSYDYNGYGC